MAGGTEDKLTSTDCFGMSGVSLCGGGSSASRGIRMVVTCVGAGIRVSLTRAGTNVRRQACKEATFRDRKQCSEICFCARDFIGTCFYSLFCAMARKKSWREQSGDNESSLGEKLREVSPEYSSKTDNNVFAHSSNSQGKHVLGDLSEASLTEKRAKKKRKRRDNPESPSTIVTVEHPVVVAPTSPTIRSRKKRRKEREDPTIDPSDIPVLSTEGSPLEPVSLIGDKKKSKKKKGIRLPSDEVEVANDTTSELAFVNRLGDGEKPEGEGSHIGQDITPIKISKPKKKRSKNKVLPDPAGDESLSEQAKKGICSSNSTDTF
jgi:hypothetical protein